MTMGTRRPPGPGRIDVRLLPMACAGWLGAWYGTDPRWPAWPAVLAVAVVSMGTVAVTTLSRRTLSRRTLRRGLAGTRNVPRRAAEERSATALMSPIVRSLVAISLCLITAVLSGAVRHSGVHTGPVAELAQQRVSANARLRLTSDVRMFTSRGSLPAMARAPARLLRLEHRRSSYRTNVDVILIGTAGQAAELAEFPAGTTLTIRVRLAPGDPTSATVAVLRVVGTPTVVDTPSAVIHAANRLREGLRLAVAASRPEQAALVPSLVVGDTSAVSQEMQENFQATALTHLMAVSGSNLTLLIGFVMPLSRWCGLRGRGLRIAGVLTVAGFVVLCRAEPSVIRAAAMGLVALFALGRGSAHGGVRALSLAVWVLVTCDPWLSRSSGFALSVVATAGIVLIAPRWRSAFGNWSPPWVSEALSVPIAAQLATQPLITAMNGSISVVGLLANLLAAPLVGPVTMLGLLAAGLSVLSAELARPVGWLAGWSGQPIIWVAVHLAELPGARQDWSAQPMSLAMLAVCCVAVMVAGPFWVRRRMVVVTVALAMIGLALRPLAPLGWPGSWQVVFCDVGQGDSTVFNLGADQALLIDVGPDSPAAARCLRGLRIRIVPVLVLTHFHSDHVGGLERLLEEVSVQRIIVSQLSSPPENAQLVRRLAAEHEIPVQVADPSLDYDLGAVSVDTVLAIQPTVTSTAGEGESSMENDSSVVVRVDMGELSVLVGGDVELAAQHALLTASSRLDVDLWKVPHHGSARQDERLWRRSRAQLAVVSCGAHNDYGHPAASTIALARRMGMALLRTDQHGSIAVWMTEGELHTRHRPAPSDR